MLLVEEFRPKHLEDVIGQNISDIRLWGETWQSAMPAKRAILLYGPPGNGKTSAAHALANDMNWEILEINTRLDVDSVKQLNNLVGHACYDKPITGGHILVIFEEIDGMSRSILKAIFNIIENSKNPVILTCNDLYSVKKKAPSLTESCMPINFRKLTKRQIHNIIDNIRDQGNIEVTPYLDTLIEQADGDLRYVISNLDSTEEPEKYNEKDIFKTVHDIFAGKWDGYSTEDPDVIFKWIQANVYDFYDDIHGEIPAEIIAKIDVIASYMRRSRGSAYKDSFKFWSYMTDYYKLFPEHQKSKMIDPPPKGFWKNEVRTLCKQKSEALSRPIYDAPQYRKAFNELVDSGLSEDDASEELKFLTLSAYTHVGTARVYSEYQHGMSKLYDDLYEKIKVDYLAVAEQSSTEPVESSSKSKIVLTGLSIYTPTETSHDDTQSPVITASDKPTVSEVHKVPENNDKKQKSLFDF